MYNLLHFQFRRLYKRALPYVLVVFILFMTFSTLGHMYEDKTTMYLPFDSSIGLGYPYKSGNVLTVGSSIIMCFSSEDSLLLLVIGIFIAIFVSEDRTKGTIKNIYSKGYSRTKIFFSKYLTAISLPAAFYFLILLVSYIYLLIRGTGTYDYSNSGNPFSILLFIFLRFLAISTFYYMLSELSSSTGGAIALNIFIPYLILIIVTVFTATLFSSEIPNNAFQHIIIDFTIISTSLFSEFMIGTDYNITELILTCLIFILLFGGLSLLITVKKQVKN